MKREDVLKMLEALLVSFHVHPALIPELLSLLSESGIENNFFNILLARLKFLNQHGILATRHKEFEPIENGIFSMHVTGAGFNIRILYAFAPDKSPVLLLAFHERAGKRKTDYTIPKKEAVKRMKEEMERKGYEH